MRPPLLLAACGLLLAGQAWAAPLSLRAEGTNPWETDSPVKQVEAKRDGQAFTLDGCLDVHALHFTGVVPGSVQHQILVGVGMGDGPPIETLDVQAVSPWKTLPGTARNGELVVMLAKKDSDGNYTRLLPNEDAAILNGVPAGFGTPAAAKPRANGTVLKSCTDAHGHFDPETGVCYTYIHEERFRLTGTDGKPYRSTFSSEACSCEYN